MGICVSPLALQSTMFPEHLHMGGQMPSWAHEIVSNFSSPKIHLLSVGLNFVEVEIVPYRYSQVPLPSVRQCFSLSVPVADGNWYWDRVDDWDGAIWTTAICDSHRSIDFHWYACQINLIKYLLITKISHPTYSVRSFFIRSNKSLVNEVRLFWLRVLKLNALVISLFLSW